MIITDRAKRGRMAEADIIDFAISQGFRLHRQAEQLLREYKEGNGTEEAHQYMHESLLPVAHEWLNGQLHNEASGVYGWWEGTYRRLDS